MSLLTVAWSICASACMMLGLIHLLSWFRDRKSYVYLLSSLMAFSAGVSAVLELGLLLTESLDTYRVLMRWENVAIFMILVPMVWFIQNYFHTGRRWLAVSITLLWGAGLVMNFLSPHSLTFIEVSELQHLPAFWGGGLYGSAGDRKSLEAARRRCIAPDYYLCGGCLCAVMAPG